MLQKLRKYSNLSIRQAIEKLGIESLCGVSHIDSTEIWDFIDMMTNSEIEEIYSIISKNTIK